MLRCSRTAMGGRGEGYVKTPSRARKATALLYHGVLSERRIILGRMR